MTEMLILCDRLYDGVTPAFHQDQAVIVQEGKVTAVRASSDADRSATDAVRVAIASPGMIDMQINGAADVQFNFDPSPEALARIAWGARQGGTAYILPTFITAHGQAYLQAIEAARQAIISGVTGILGIHVEGPFLSPARPGIHTPSAIRPLEEKDVAALERQALDFPGVILLTLAPECQEPGYLDRLAASGIILFAGHSEATPAHLSRIRGATHLWNAMPPPASRAPGIVSEVLGGDRLFAGIIADGFHVGAHALKMSVRAAADRLCLVTDAMMTLSGKSDGFELDGRRISLADGRLTGEGGTLAGAHIAMDASIQTLIELTGLDPVSALKMATINPARALGLDNCLGRIVPGAIATMSLFDERFSAVGVVNAGRLSMREEIARQR